MLVKFAWIFNMKPQDSKQSLIFLIHKVIDRPKQGSLEHFQFVLIQ